MTIQQADAEAARVLGLEHKLKLGSTPEAPLVFLVHGRAGNYDVMWTFRRCIPETFTIVAPQAPLIDPLGGFSWWQINEKLDQQDVTVAANTLRLFIQNTLLHYKIAPSKIIGFGFSQGAGLLSFIIQKQPAIFDGVALLAGFVITVEPPEQLKIPPIFMAHGTLDPTISIEKARHGAAYLREHHTTVTYVEDAVGHKVGSGAMRALKEWCAKVGT